MELLRRVCKLHRIFAPRLERAHLELIARQFIGYDSNRAERGYWIYSCPRGEDYLIVLDGKWKTAEA